METLLTTTEWVLGAAISMQVAFCVQQARTCWLHLRHVKIGQPQLLIDMLGGQLLHSGGLHAAGVQMDSWGACSMSQHAACRLMLWGIDT